MCILLLLLGLHRVRESDAYKLGEYVQNGQCVSCPPGCVSCVSDLQCLLCKSKYYGHSCSLLCPKNCYKGQCHKTTGTCDVCQMGFYPNADKTCIACPINCEVCESGSSCLKCRDGFKGQVCQEKCSNCSPNTKCGKSNGYCFGGCKDGFSGYFCSDECDTKCASCHRRIKQKCLFCANDTFGTDCNRKCSENCDANSCDDIDGTCTYGCSTGFWGHRCEIRCSEHCKNRNCERLNGNCIEGCLDDYTEPKCQCPVNCVCDKNEFCQTCKVGFKGEKCQHLCSEGCFDRICDRFTGECLAGCFSGYTGNRCETECHACVNTNCSLEINECKKFCVARNASIHCNATCNRNCVYLVCNDDSVECVVCISGYMGKSCNVTCSAGCIDGLCTQDTGECLKGCMSGYFGPTCDSLKGENETSFKSDKSVILSADELIVSLSVLGILLVFATSLVVVCVFLRKRKKGSKTISHGPDRLSSCPNAGIQLDIMADSVEQESTYQTINEEDDMYESPVVSSICSVYVDGTLSRKDGVPVRHFGSYIANMKQEKFLVEFEELRCDLGKQQTSESDENPSKYYSEIADPSSNACWTSGCTGFVYNEASFVDSYRVSKAYIAAAAPTRQGKEITDFWKMIWQKQSRKIVMLSETRTAEGQYWPEQEYSERYGDLTVICRKELKYPDFTIREIEVQSDYEARLIIQYQYSAWREEVKHVNIASFVEFLTNVKANRLKGPVLVLCSKDTAGATTFIALDILAATGKAEGFVNVFGCLQRLQKQSSNFIQTVEQYEFLHRTLAQILSYYCQTE